MGPFARRCKKTALALLIAVAAGPAMAQVPDLEPLNYKVRYDVYWNSVPLGRVRIETQEDQFGYRISVDTKTRGIASLFGAQQGYAETRGRVVEGTAMPQRYSSTSSSDDGARTTTITYEEDGSIKKRDRKPQDDPAWRPIVPLEEANTATDPITGFIRLRKQMHANMASNTRDTKLRTYEGARLAEFNFRVISRASIEVMKKSTNAINIVATRTPVNGYTPKELKKFKKGDPTVHVYFSADGRFIPLQADVALGFGSLTAKLTEFKRN